MNILGISALYHDSAAALICDGEIIAAVSEERFTRKKADSSIPVHAINYCLDKVTQIGQKRGIDCVVYYDNPLLTLDRWLENCISVSPDNEQIIEKSFQSLLAYVLWKDFSMICSLSGLTDMQFSSHLSSVRSGLS